LAVDDGWWKSGRLEGWKIGRMVERLLLSVHNGDPPFVELDAADVLTVSE
jgi:hypothetical protein